MSILPSNSIDRQDTPSLYKTSCIEFNFEFTDDDSDYEQLSIPRSMSGNQSKHQSTHENISTTSKNTNNPIRNWLNIRTNSAGRAYDMIKNMSGRPNSGKEVQRRSIITSSTPNNDEHSPRKSYASNENV